MYLHESGLLGASPDAVADEFTVEIKCPYSYRDEFLQHVLQIEQLKKKKKKYVIYLVNTGNELKLMVDRKHPYYHQIQAQIHFSKRKYGYLFVWTSKSNILVKIDKDDAWESHINSMLSFYHNQFVPHILSSV